MELIDVIKARHSVRKYLDKPIEAAKVATLRATVERINADSPEQEKAGKSFDFPALVGQTLRISNLRILEGLQLIQEFLDGIE